MYIIGGNGAYTKGEIKLEKGTILYLYVGEEGGNRVEGGYNGGGNLTQTAPAYGCSGGGATDVRLSGGAWDDEQGLKNRIMVAGAGGGANNRNYKSTNYKYGAGNGGAGGELEGINGETIRYKAEGNIPSYNDHGYGSGGTQTEGGHVIRLDEQNNMVKDVLSGGFGLGGGIEIQGQSGGGSGYYGGATSSHGAAGGGSSFISGYTGCNAINAEGEHTNQPNHFSNFVFTNAQMIAGNKTMPSARTSDSTVGNDGNGYIKISFIK